MARAEGSGRQPTLREVAERAGVSPMTASRTLAGSAGVSPELRDRVLQAVAELGYRRNENARSLRPGQASGLVGVAITNLANPYYSEFALGVEDVAEAHGRRILLGSTGEDLAKEKQLIADFLGRQVEGLVVVPAGPASDHLDPRCLGGVPLVLASRALPGLKADTALLADVNGARQATREIIDMGHKRIAFLGTATSVATAERRFAGFSQALAEAGIPVLDELVRHGQADPGSARERMGELLDLDEPPSAVFCANNRNTIGVVQAIAGRLRDGRISAAEVPFLVAFDDFELADTLPFPLLIVSHDARELGRQAATMLFDRMDHPGEEPAPRFVEIPLKLRRVN